MLRSISAVAFFLSMYASAVSQEAGCTGSTLKGVKGLNSARVLADGSLVGRSKMNINIDGYARAYHPKNAEAGAVIHLCNAGDVYLPNGQVYSGSNNDYTCTGRFMDDFKKIRDAGWKDPNVGAINWYGILAKSNASIAGQRIGSVEPVYQADGSGFFVSPTTLLDRSIRDESVQDRYINPLRIPAAVIPSRAKNGSTLLAKQGVVMGSLGVAIDPAKGVPVPFVVGDGGPRVGEGTPALARRLAGLQASSTISRANRFAGQVDQDRIVWVFFGSTAPVLKFNSKNESALINAAQKAFDGWGGLDRLKKCL